MKIYDAADIVKKLAELRAKQSDQKLDKRVFGSMELDEVARIAKLAREYFGDRADVFALPAKPGVLHVGYFHDDDRSLPPHRRKETVVAEGRSHRDIADQLALWKAAQG